MDISLLNSHNSSLPRFTECETPQITFSLTSQTKKKPPETHINIIFCEFLAVFTPFHQAKVILYKRKILLFFIHTCC